jgi:hypothetical protein
MLNRNLSPTELRDLFGPLFADVKAKLEIASDGDSIKLTLHLSNDIKKHFTAKVS